MGPVYRQRGTPRLQWFVAEGAPESIAVSLPGSGGRIDVAPDGRGLLALTGEADLTPAGLGFVAHLEEIGSHRARFACGPSVCVEM
ncbi:MAG: hypothetical protein NTU62_07215 [Spirochaetes bacterium]|nr:hypothetical protein [Spirochaetota bacterium]